MKIERGDFMEYQIITNNPNVNSSNENVFFIKGSLEDVLVKVRDLEKEGIKTVLITDECS